MSSISITYALEILVTAQACPKMDLPIFKIWTGILDSDRGLSTVKVECLFCYYQGGGAGVRIFKNVSIEMSLLDRRGEGGEKPF